MANASQMLLLIREHQQIGISDFYPFSQGGNLGKIINNKALLIDLCTVLIDDLEMTYYIKIHREESK